MAQFIIHAGYSKTGTTALQRYLAFNRCALREQGILYPDIRHMRSWLRIESHNAIAASLVGLRPWPRLKPEEYFRQIECQLRASPELHTVILSGESFMGLPQPWFTASLEDYWQAQTDKVTRLRSLLGQQDARIVVYLRRQDQWLESAIKHTVKFEGLLPRRVFRSVAEFAKLHEPYLDYASVLDLWAHEFGENNLDIGVYEKRQLRSGDVIDDFFARVGIQRPPTFREPHWDEAASNTALPRDFLEVKRILNEIPKPKYEERFIIRALQQIARETAPTGGNEPAFLSPKETHSLLKSYRKCNEEVALRFLNRPSADLFREPMPDPDSAWVSYPGLSVERANEIQNRLDEQRTSMRGRVQLTRHRIAALLRIHAPILHAAYRAGRQTFTAIGRGQS